jgi:lipopolysaccharide export system permease protein
MGFLTLFLVVDFIEKISDFMTHEIPVVNILTYFAAQIPNIIILLIPVASLAAILITLMLLARNSEIVAFKGSGVSLWRLSIPFLGTGLVLCGLVFVLGNLVTPTTNAIANEIWEGQVRGRRPENSMQVIQDVWTRDIRLIEHFNSYDETKSMAEGVSILLMDEDLFLKRRLEAEVAYFQDGGVLLEGVQVKDYHGLKGDDDRYFTFQRLERLFLEDFPAPAPGLGSQSETNSDELDFRALRENIRLLQKEGFYPVHQMVDLQFKFSRPFITLIMLMVGIPIGFWREKGGSVAMGLVPGLILSFIYLVTLEFSRTIGYAGFLPPFLSAWLPNCFFLLLGLYLFSYVRQ